MIGEKFSKLKLDESKVENQSLFDEKLNPKEADVDRSLIEVRKVTVTPSFYIYRHG